MRSAASAPRLVDLIRQARAIVLDFDGTLVDSNPIKQRAFERCFAGFPERREEIMTYCWNHHHTPRGEKFRHVYEQILRQPYTAEVATGLQARFEAATTQQIIDAPEIPGATRFLAAVAGARMTALLSSTPHDVLLRILSARGWQQFFRWIQGAPVRKASWLAQLRARYGLRPQHVVFFGDTREDAEAAQEAGCTFLAIGGAAAARSGYSLEDFTSLFRGAA